MQGERERKKGDGRRRKKRGRGEIGLGEVLTRSSLLYTHAYLYITMPTDSSREIIGPKIMCVCDHKKGRANLGRRGRRKRRLEREGMKKSCSSIIAAEDKRSKSRS